MTPISLIMSMSSPSSLIILLPSCLMLNCLFNLASVQLGLCLAPLEFVSLVKYYCFQGGIKIFDVPFGSVFFIFFLYKKLYAKMFNMET
jgi:hypothetical protein